MTPKYLLSISSYHFCHHLLCHSNDIKRSQVSWLAPISIFCLGIDWFSFQLGILQGWISAGVFHQLIDQPAEEDPSRTEQCDTMSEDAPCLITTSVYIWLQIPIANFQLHLLKSISIRWIGQSIISINPPETWDLRQWKFCHRFLLPPVSFLHDIVWLAPLRERDERDRCRRRLDEMSARKRSAIRNCSNIPLWTRAERAPTSAERLTNRESRPK